MKFTSPKNLRRFGSGLLFTLLCINANQASSNELTEQIKNCSAIAQATERLACYDSLSQSIKGNETALDEVDAKSETPAAVETSEGQTAKEESDAQTEGIPDSLGGGSFSDRAGVKVQSYRGRVTSCKKASDRKWFYIFENGQVWKQVDSRKRRHRNCDFMVSITKDSFGYKMVVDGQESKIRIDRRR